MGRAGLVGLGNARDSFVDLLVAKEQRDELRRLIEEQGDDDAPPSGAENPRNVGTASQKTEVSFRVKPGRGVRRGGGTHEARSSGGKLNEKRDGDDGVSSEAAAAVARRAAAAAAAGISFASSRAPAPLDSSSSSSEEEELCYEPIEVGYEDESEWPIWEMTGDSEQDMQSLAESERIFTVPEVYEELERQGSSTVSILRDEGNGGTGGPCDIMLGCLMPWKRRPTIALLRANSDAFSNMSSRSLVVDDEEGDVPPRGVIKRSSIAVQLYLGMPLASRQSYTPSMYKVLTDKKGEDGQKKKSRSSLVGSNQMLYSPSAEKVDREEGTTSPPPSPKRKRYKVHFGELKQVLRVRKIAPKEAVEVWYQREDFETFKNQMTLLIQEECHEVADVWLDDDGEGRGKWHRASTSSDDAGGSAGGDGVAGMSIRDSAAAEDLERVSGSWWHDYDHSRRGLERYVSPGQAMEIHNNLKSAVKEVLGEQNRQRWLKWLCIPAAADPEKIARVYHEHTAWSRDLALAAGASDADAVATDFDDSKRHTREYYMLKQVVKSGYRVHKHMPEFMLPKCITPRGYLDETESLYIDNRRGAGGKGGGTGMLRTLVGGGLKSASGGGGVDGPVSPALAVSLGASDGGINNGRASGAHASPKASAGRRSMAEKAQNYPFQQ